MSFKQPTVKIFDYLPVWRRDRRTDGKTDGQNCDG